MKVLKSACIDSLEAISIDVEASFTKGLPSFSIVGLVSSSIQESRDRVKSSLLSNDFKFPPKKITINLSPSDVNKSGTHFDLPIALLIALYDKNISFEDFYVFAELGLDGKLKDTKTMFAMILCLAEQKLIKNVLIPYESYEKISKIPNLNIYCVKTFSQACDFFTFKNKENSRVKNIDFIHDKIIVHNKEYFYSKVFVQDFKDVKGQLLAKQAALISAAGNHNILFTGSPGCGKSMISKRIRYIMPPLSIEDILQKAKLDSLELKEPDFLPNVVFRNPHHTSTKASVFGGGSTTSRIGEVALANKGILFFDELPHFPKMLLEALREPLEDHSILISRVNSKINYPTKFLFIAAMNPCACGNLLSLVKNCICSDLDIKKYKAKLSEPFLDRIDLFVTMNEVDYEEASDISSFMMQEKVLQAFVKQKQRGQKDLNGKLNDEENKKFCILDEASNKVLNQAIVNFQLSFRAINKVLKISRTIADLDNEDEILKKHLLQALSFRKR